MVRGTGCGTAVSHGGGRSWQARYHGNMVCRPPLSGASRSTLSTDLNGTRPREGLLVVECWPMLPNRMVLGQGIDPGTFGIVPFCRSRGRRYQRQHGMPPTALNKLSGKECGKPFVGLPDHSEPQMGDARRLDITRESPSFSTATRHSLS